MAATVYLQEWNGAAPGVATSKQGGTIQFKSSDDAAVEALPGAANPLTVPNAGVFRSYEKYLQPHLENLNGAANISNVELFISGSTPDDGVSIQAKVANAYADPLAGGYEAGGAMAGPKEDLFTKDTNDPLVLGAGPFAAAPANIGDFAVLQMEIYPSAALGATSNFDIVLRWDEA